MSENGKTWLCALAVVVMLCVVGAAVVFSDGTASTAQPKQAWRQYDTSDKHSVWQVSEGPDHKCRLFYRSGLSSSSPAYVSEVSCDLAH